MASVPGTDATGLLLVRLTVEPVAGAGPLSVTVPVDGPPPATDGGASASADTVGEGRTVSVTTLVVGGVVGKVAVTLTLVCAETAVDVSENVALELPAGTTTLAGTATTEGALLVRVTVVADVARASRLAVPVAGFPPSNSVGVIDRAGERVATQAPAAFEYSVCTS